MHDFPDEPHPPSLQDRLADQHSRARTAVSFSNIEPHQAKHMAKVLGARCDVGQTKATLKKL